MSNFHDFAPRYGGRVIKLEVYVNSDESTEKVGRRVRNAARGQKINAVVCTVALFEGEKGREAWALISKFVAQAATDPSLKPIDDTVQPEDDPPGA